MFRVRGVGRGVKLTHAQVGQDVGRLGEILFLLGEV